jgi:cold shock CspA family protein
MTEAMEFGSRVGRVIRFFNRKGYGFVTDLNDNTDYFVHNSEIQVKDGIYRKLYPGEYVSYNLVEREGKQTCSDVRGIMGYPLLVENEEHTFRVYPKQEQRQWPPSYEDTSDDTDTDMSDGDDAVEEPEPEKEIINKEAPPGIEVAEFDGLNINEEMG